MKKSIEIQLKSPWKVKFLKLDSNLARLKKLAEGGGGAGDELPAAPC